MLYVVCESDREIQLHAVQDVQLQAKKKKINEEKTRENIRNPMKKNTAKKRRIPEKHTLTAI